MKILLDTQAFIWFVTDNPNLSLVAKELIEKADNQKFLSMASVWEMAIKQSIGKLRFSLPLREFMDQHIEDKQYRDFADRIKPH
ncbi:type II toxin-antitoxin system VapC family toxin [[Phormidium] sp. ETS-05]|uniref:type II toxin-antitoxin system VapC family toxin n=1 Tax=[Phormidium] sp. ETS-05 TaxID=222819 RepID=UPI001E3B2190|nr:type II toxin-antitoxin system VapC family toxin [[Phormidium] sp. ETS-05]